MYNQFSTADLLESKYVDYHLNGGESTDSDFHKNLSKKRIKMDSRNLLQTPSLYINTPVHGWVGLKYTEI